MNHHFEGVPGQPESPGRMLARHHVLSLQPRAASVRDRLGRPATLAILAADDTVNQRHVEIKRNAFREAGLELRSIALAQETDTPALLHRIDALNRAGDIDAVFLQFPLPAAIDPVRCGDAVTPLKDIDAAGSYNLGRVLAGHARYVPAAPAAILTLLEHALGDLHARSIVLVGTDGVVERCVALLGIMKGATLCLLPPAAEELPDYAAGADAVVITGDLPTADALRHVRNGAVLLDAGYFLPPRPRDWLPERTRAHLGAWLQQYGNIGPLTVAFLMESTLRAARG